MDSGEPIPAPYKKQILAVIFASIFAAFGIATVATKTFDLVSLQCVLIPQGFLTLVHFYGPSNSFYLIFMVVAGFMFGKAVQRLWNWKRWSLVIMLFALAANAYGFFIWFISQLDW